MYPLTFYIKSGKIPSGFAGLTFGPVVLIDEAYRDDRGLLVHELTHVQHWAVLTALCSAVLWWLMPYDNVWTQLAISATIYGLLYQIVAPFRLWAEIHCYRRQLAVYRDEGMSEPELARRKSRLAQIIMTKYDDAHGSRSQQWIESRLQ